MRERVDFSSIDVPWPVKGREFWGQDDSKHTDAHIHWIRDLGFDLADAFKLVGDFAIAEVSRGGDGTHPDRFALPILYLYRHAIELQLKLIVRQAIRLRLLERSNGLDDLLNSEHDLKRLWSNARMAMQKRWPGAKPTDLQVVQEYIFILDDIDPDGQRFRYDHFSAPPKRAAQSRSGGIKVARIPAVESLPDVFGLRYLAERVDELFALLRGTAIAFDVDLDNLAEMEQEFGP